MAQNIVFMSAIDAALERNAQVIVFNELAFPSVDGRPMGEAIQFARARAQERGVLIVAGSTHVEESRLNTSYIFFPGCPPAGVQYHKQISAAYMSEHDEDCELVSAPPRRATVCVEAFGLHIAVLICIDLADYSSVAPIVRLGDKIDLLLVPCYSPFMEPLERIAMEASKAMTGAVALVNHFSPPKPSAYVYYLGEPTRLGVPRTTVPGAGIVYYVLDTRALKRQQRSVDVASDNRLGWLFGLAGARVLENPAPMQP